MTNRMRSVVFAPLLGFALLTVNSWAQNRNEQPDYRNPALPLTQRVDDLVGRMTLAEKVSQMQNNAPAIPRLGVPAYNWWNEGLHGVARSGYATVFPQAIGLAATWDTDLLHRVATTISTEARAKHNEAIRHNIHSIYYGLTFWSPNINIFRDPRWGRGQETYGEDPFLTSRLGVAFVTGLQGSNPDYLKVVATPKHFAVHSGPESIRHRFNVDPSPFDLEDTYLPAFRATITEGHADSIMCSYNAINDVPACANRELLQNVLRRQWGFDGYVTSDCGAISDFYSAEGHHYSADKAHAAAAGVLAGTDTSCGTEYSALTKAVQEGLLPESAIDTAVKRLFTARFRLGMFDPPSKIPYARIPFSEDDSPAHRALALAAARKAMVLLKNDADVLPLRNNIHTLAVIGPNAASLAALEGNYNGVPLHPVLPVDGMEQEFGSRAKILYAQGAPYDAQLPLPAPRTIFHPASGASPTGLKAEYFATSNLTGKPAITRIDQQVDFDWNAASPAPGIPANDFGVRWTGVIAAPQAGEYKFNIAFGNCGPCSDRESYTVYFDGKQVATQTTDASKPYRPSTNPPFSLPFSDAKPHSIRIDYTHHSPLFGGGITLNWQPPPGSLLPEAVAVAKKADAVLAFVGLSPELEGEEMPVHVEGFSGGDRTKIDLPASQQEMLQAVADTGKPLIVVLMNGSALAVGWAQQHAAAILEAWYPGEAGGQAIAETLSGKNNPGGRLPVTFYASLDQVPPFTDYSMKGRTYRFFHGQPLYRFGYGLSYTHFTYSNLHLSSTNLNAGDTLTVEADVKNTGSHPGDEVVELYITPPSAAPDGLLYALKSFQRISIRPKESRHIVFKLEPRQLSEVAANGKRSVQPGNYTLAIGGGQPVENSGDLSATFAISGTKSLPQ